MKRLNILFMNGHKRQSNFQLWKNLIYTSVCHTHVSNQIGYPLHDTGMYRVVDRKYISCIMYRVAYHKYHIVYPIQYITLIKTCIVQRIASIASCIYTFVLCIIKTCTSTPVSCSILHIAKHIVYRKFLIIMDSSMAGQWPD